MIHKGPRIVFPPRQMDDLSKRNSRTCCYGKDVISKSCQHKLPSPELIPAIANSQFRPLQRKSSSQPKVFLELAEEGLAVLLLAAWPTGSGYFTCHSRSYTWFCLLHWDWMWHQSSKHSLLSAELYSANQTSKTTDRANTPIPWLTLAREKQPGFQKPCMFQNQPRGMAMLKVFLPHHHAFHPSPLG